VKFIPSQEDHYNAAISNLNFYKLNKNNLNKYPDWGIVILFYELIHLIERVLAISPIKKEYQHSRNHKQRYRTMQNMRTKIPKEILTKYRIMSNLSRNARYDYGKITLEILQNFEKEEYNDLKYFFQNLFREFRKYKR